MFITKKPLVFAKIVAALVAVLTVDALTKVWAEKSLTFYQPVPVAGQFLRLTLNYNTGVAFGLFANGGLLPIILTGGIIAGMIIWLLQLLKSNEFPAQTACPIGLFLGGAIANFVDRFLDGRVTDFLDAGFGAARWPTFNLADTFIIVGITALILLTWLDERRRNPNKSYSKP